MRTSRSDIRIDSRRFEIPYVSYLRNLSWILKKNDMFTYKEHYMDSTCGIRLAKCHGGVTVNGERFILAQVANRISYRGAYLITSTVEQWVKPEDVVETFPEESVDKNIRQFFLDKAKLRHRKDSAPMKDLSVTREIDNGAYTLLCGTT